MTQRLTCEGCSAEFVSVRSRRTRFCSHACYTAQQQAIKYSKYARAEYLGARFGSRIVSAIIPGGGRDTYWIMLCDCGKYSKRVASSSLMKQKSCRSCSSLAKGANRKSKWPSGVNIDGQLYRRWVVNADLRDIRWDLSIEFLDELIRKQNWTCALSGEILVSNKLGNCSVDRIDSDLHYSPDNTQLVTKMVNMCKQSYSNEQFVAMCEKVASHHQGGTQC